MDRFGLSTKNVRDLNMVLFLDPEQPCIGYEVFFRLQDSGMEELCFGDHPTPLDFPESFKEYSVAIFGKKYSIGGGLYVRVYTWNTDLNEWEYVLKPLCSRFDTNIRIALIALEETNALE